MTKKIDPNYGLGNDAKGKMHEILVGHFLLHGTEHEDPNEHKLERALPRFPDRPPGSKEVKKKKSIAVAETGQDLHDHFKLQISNTDYSNHVRIAKFATDGILHSLKDLGRLSNNDKQNSGRITNVFWTSHPNDIEILSGEKDEANNSDIVIKSPKLSIEIDEEEHIGISLKMHCNPKPSNLANNGRGTLDKLFLNGDNTDHFEEIAIETAHKAAEMFGINTRNISKKQAHDTIKNNLDIKHHWVEIARYSLYGIANHYFDALKKLDSNELAEVLITLSNIKPTKMPVYRSITTGTHTLSHTFTEPNIELEKIMQCHGEHLKVEKDLKSYNIKFEGKNSTPIGSLGLKWNSRTPHTGIIGILQGWKASAKASINDKEINTS